MQPIATIPASTCVALRGVFMDIDDTLTSDGKLTAEAYAALWRMRESGLKVVPVTGRPAGWCDLIARQWPVDGVIGENGALAFYQDTAGRMHRMLHPAAVPSRNNARLSQIEKDILSNVVGARVAADQPFRMFDLAIDFREEPPDLGFAAAEQIRAIFAKNGAHAKVSSIHVNGWLGDYDKLSMVQQFARARWDVEMPRDASSFLFCGDSPNDEPMFAAFAQTSCAVANIAPFVATMRSLPFYVTQRAGGAGFAELVATVLARRAG